MQRTSRSLIFFIKAFLNVPYENVLIMYYSENSFALLKVKIYFEVYFCGFTHGLPWCDGVDASVKNIDHF